MSYDPTKRLAAPGEDDYQVERIEVEFAIPVFLTPGQQQRLTELVHEIAKAPANTPVHGVHWQSGVGSKPHWSKMDAAFLGRTAEPDAPETGEPTFDDSILHIETSARAASANELQSYNRTQ